MKGSVFWMAPEVIHSANERTYSGKIDIWSLGCVVLEMWTGKRPWGDMEQVAAMFEVSCASLWWTVLTAAVQQARAAAVTPRREALRECAGLYERAVPREGPNRSAHGKRAVTASVDPRFGQRLDV